MNERAVLWIPGSLDTALGWGTECIKSRGNPDYQITGTDVGGGPLPVL